MGDQKAIQICCILNGDHPLECTGKYLDIFCTHGVEKQPLVSRVFFMLSPGFSL